MTSDEIFGLARDAIKRMALEKGPTFRFSYDQIWDFLPVGADVPSGRRPGPQRRLLREGLLRRTGSLRNAASGSRAGSLGPEYTFGFAIVGARHAESQTKVIDILKDDRTNCFSVLAVTSVEEYLNFVEIPYYDRAGGIEGQRGPLTTNTAVRIRKTMIADIEGGAILPPVVVGLVVSPEVVASAQDVDTNSFKELLDTVPVDNISIIDGMQRTAALVHLREMPHVLRRTMRVEFWLASNTNSLIYRMLVLNTGQVPWNLRRQIEVIHKALLEELKAQVPSIEVLEQDEARRRAKHGQFQADRLVELYMVFGARKEKVDTQERLADEFTRLDFIEATALHDFTLQFFEVLRLLANLDQVFDDYEGGEATDRFASGRDLFSSQPACIGFVAAAAIDIFGRPGIERSVDQQIANLEKLKQQAAGLVERLSDLQPAEIGRFLDFDTLNEVCANKSVARLGDFQREFFLKAFQALLEEKFEVTSMAPCWRAF